MLEERGTSFADLLRQLRSAAALSQEGLAERSGLSVRGISDLERGLSQAPRLETVRLLADGLALGADERAALLAAARPAQSPLLRALTSHPTNLTVAPTALIGRDEDLVAVQRRLGHES